jgi:hypothetical protein
MFDSGCAFASPYETPLRGFSSRRARNNSAARAALPEENKNV